MIYGARGMDSTMAFFFFKWFTTCQVTLWWSLHLAFLAPLECVGSETLWCGRWGECMRGMSREVDDAGHSWYYNARMNCY